MRDLCDIAHALWVDRVIGDFRTEQQALATAALLGSKVESWPTLAERLERFEAALAAEPPRVDPEDQELRKALGLRSSGG